MQQCNETITVINAKFNQQADKDEYHATVITGVSWFCNIETTVNSGLKAADKFVVRIPDDADFSGKSFVQPNEYAAAQNVESVFTLKNGDIIVRGAVSGSGLKLATLLSGNEAFTILGVTDSRHRPHGRHWKEIGS